MIVFFFKEKEIGMGEEREQLDWGFLRESGAALHGWFIVEIGAVLGADVLVDLQMCTSSNVVHADGEQWAPIECCEEVDIVTWR